MTIIDLETGESYTQTALKKFSSSRMVIANFTNAELLIRELIAEIPQSPIPFLLGYLMLMQVCEKVEGGLGEIEIRSIKDIGEQAGAIFVEVVEHHRILSNEEALNLLMEAKNLQ